MAFIRDTTQELVQDTPRLESLRESPIPEAIVNEIFENLEELNWEPSEEDFEELREKLCEEEADEEGTPAPLSASTEELCGEDRGEFLDLPGPLEAAVTLILHESLSPGNRKTFYTARYACLSLLFDQLPH